MSKYYTCENCHGQVRVSHVAFMNLSKEHIDKLNSDFRIDSYSSIAQIISDNEERYLEVHCNTCNNPNIPDYVEELAMHLGCEIIIQQNNNHPKKD